MLKLLVLTSMLSTVHAAELSNSFRISASFKMDKVRTWWQINGHHVEIFMDTAKREKVFVGTLKLDQEKNGRVPIEDKVTFYKNDHDFRITVRYINPENKHVIDQIALPSPDTNYQFTIENNEKNQYALPLYIEQKSTGLYHMTEAIRIDIDEDPENTTFPFRFRIKLRQNEDVKAFSDLHMTSPVFSALSNFDDAEITHGMFASAYEKISQKDLTMITLRKPREDIYNPKCQTQLLDEYAQQKKWIKAMMDELKESLDKDLSHQQIIKVINYLVFKNIISAIQVKPIKDEMGIL